MSSLREKKLKQLVNVNVCLRSEPWFSLDAALVLVIKVNRPVHINVI